MRSRLLALVLALVLVLVLALGFAPGCDRPAPPTHAVTVTIAAPGASAAVVEATLIEPIEAALAGVPGVRTLYARADQGLALLAVTSEEPELATLVHARLTQLRAQLPADARPEVRRGSPSPTPAAAFAITGTSPPITLSELADHLLRRRLERLAGVAGVELRGASTRRLQLRADPRLAPVALARALELPPPGGRLDESSLPVRLTFTAPLGITRSSSFGTQTIQLGATTIPLRDLVQVAEVAVPSSDEPLHLRIVLQEGADRDAVLARVDAELAQLRAELPPGIAITPHPLPPPPSPRLAVCGPDRAVLARLAGTPPRPSTLAIGIDRERAASLGVDIADIARTLGYATGAPLGYAEDRPIVLVVEPAAVPTLLVPSRAGDVRLSELTTHVPDDDAEPRERVDRVPARAVGDPRALPAELPPGYRRCVL